MLPCVSPPARPPGRLGARRQRTEAVLSAETPPSRTADQAGTTTGTPLYSAAPQATRTVYINQASQTITWPDPPTPIDFANNLTFTLSATGGASGNPIVFASTTPTRCTVSGNIVSVVSGNGQCALTASQAGNTNYAAAPTEVRYVYINKGDQSITFDPLSDRPLNPNTFMVSATASSGLSVTFQSQTAAKCTVSGTTVTMIATGTCTVRARQTGNGNWAAAANVDRSFTILAGSQAPQTITFNALADKVVTDAPFSIAASATATSNLTVTFTSATTGICTATGTNGATITLVAPGTCTINANQAGNAAYLPAPQVSRSFNVADTPKVYFVHPDHLGTPRAITRTTDNQVVWKWDNSDPFGANAPNENPSGLGTVKNNNRFPGQYFDEETGTHYNYFRDYDPSIGRYVQSDPIGLLGGINTFGYVGQNPLGFLDRFGLQASPEEQLTPPKPNPWPILRDTYYEMKKKDVPGTDQYFHCLATCRALKDGSDVKTILWYTDRKENRDFLLNLAGMYGKERLSTREMLEDNERDRKVNRYGTTCPPDVDCYKHCSKYLDGLEPKRRRFMREYRTEW